MRKINKNENTEFSYMHTCTLISKKKKKKKKRKGREEIYKGVVY